jgi:hypothetical protein
MHSLNRVKSCKEKITGQRRNYGKWIRGDTFFAPVVLREMNRSTTENCVVIYDMSDWNSLTMKSLKEKEYHNSLSNL